MRRNSGSFDGSHMTEDRKRYVMSGDGDHDWKKRLHLKMRRKHVSLVRRYRMCAFLAALFVMTVMTGCNDTAKETNKLVIADQFGLAYAPIEVLKETPILTDVLKAHGLEDVTVEWVRMGNTAAIREAMVAGQLDIGFVAIPPFLLGREGGMDWKIISGISESPVGLVAKEDGTSFETIDGSKRIILPQLGSVQHILLAMASERTFGDATALDAQVVAMTHPDGMTAMLSDTDSYLHFTTPPYLEQELADSQFTTLIDGETCFGGPFTFIVGICPERVYAKTELYTAFSEALDQAIDYLNASPDEASALLKQAYEYPEDVIDAVLEDPSMRFSSEVNGLEHFQSFMAEMGLLETVESSGGLFWDEQ
ncbi:ABC transporter substrate-binding protein [Fusibacter paucivorans]|uniref:ABC transporter substrate-binding protein n=1 Tax=Fusibacter paucivorans TaxID=76009 RepID=A0ABS5PNF8_9FIRM|nr:ABC transporter substrate-binding protein [Fusibacter paucivorans]MBS7525587.1 ABC transporter substrate-binding protein [Fusibacter paucivorans]